MGGGRASKSQITLVGSCSGDRDTAVALASEVGGTAVAAEEGIAGVASLSGDGDAGITLTLGVLPAVHDAVTLIGTRARDGDTGATLAHAVGLSAATEEEIALVLAQCRNDDAGGFQTFRVLAAANLEGTLIAAGSCLGNAGAVVADEVVLAGALVIGDAGIGAGSLDSDALVLGIAFRV